MKEIVIAIMTCLNVNSGWWCGKPSNTVYLTGNISATYQTTEYREMDDPAIDKIVRVLYSGDKSWDERVAPYPLKNGCLVIVSNVREQQYVSNLTCEQLRKNRKQIKTVKY